MNGEPALRETRRNLRASAPNGVCLRIKKKATQRRSGRRLLERLAKRRQTQKQASLQSDRWTLQMSQATSQLYRQQLPCHSRNQGVEGCRSQHHRKHQPPRMGSIS